MRINWAHIGHIIKGSWRSLTMWVAAVFAALPEVIPVLQSNFQDLAPFIPDWMESPALRFAALLMVLTRLKTSRSLADKGRGG